MWIIAGELRDVIEYFLNSEETSKKFKNVKAIFYSEYFLTLIGSKMSSGLASIR